MPRSSATNLPPNNDPKFDIGWQKLTTDEFLEAIASAVVEKLQMLKPTEPAEGVALREGGEVPRQAWEVDGTGGHRAE